MKNRTRGVREGLATLAMGATALMSSGCATVEDTIYSIPSWDQQLRKAITGESIVKGESYRGAIIRDLVSHDIGSDKKLFYIPHPYLNPDIGGKKEYQSVLANNRSMYGLITHLCDEEDACIVTSARLEGKISRSRSRRELRDLRRMMRESRPNDMTKERFEEVSMEYFQTSFYWFLGLERGHNIRIAGNEDPDLFREHQESLDRSDRDESRRLLERRARYAVEETLRLMELGGMNKGVIVHDFESTDVIVNSALELGANIDVITTYRNEENIDLGNRLTREQR